MAFQILLNLVIAFIWMFLYSDFSPNRFILGYLVGIACIGLLSRFWPHGFYLRKLWAIIKLLVLFMKELLISSVTVLLQIVQPRLSIRPGIFAYETKLTTDWEISILSCLICLTPGTLTLDVSHDGRTLYIHAMDIEDAALVSEQIRGTFEKAIQEVTRS